MQPMLSTDHKSPVPCPTRHKLGVWLQVVHPGPPKPQALPVTGHGHVRERLGHGQTPGHDVPAGSQRPHAEHGLLRPPHEPGQPGHMQYTGYQGYTVTQLHSYTGHRTHGPQDPGNFPVGWTLVAWHVLGITIRGDLLGTVLCDPFADRVLPVVVVPGPRTCKWAIG